MLRTIFLTLVTLGIAIGFGAGSLYWTLDTAAPTGARHSGPWVAFPDTGSPTADPYSRARFAREGGVPLGSAEGIVFSALHDSAGLPLNRSCTYGLMGAFPAARFWTLHAIDDLHLSLPLHGQRPTAIHSNMLVDIRSPSPSALVTISPDPTPGNWMPLTGHGSFGLVLTLFDTPLSSGFRLAQFKLPEIIRLGCNA